MLAYYSSDDYFVGSEGIREGYSDYQTQEPALRQTFRHFLGQLQKNDVTGGRLLEVGCGYGYLLDEAKPFFDYRAGTDYSQDAVDHAKKHADEVYLGGVDAVGESGSFDCAIAVEVLEHVYEPNRFMQALAHRLKPGGQVAVAVPDMGSPWRHLMQRFWPSFKVPEHVTYYDHASMRKLFEQNGFTDLRRIAFPHLFPLSLVAEKLHIPLKGRLGEKNVWLPGIVLAMAGRLK